MTNKYESIFYSDDMFITKDFLTEHFIKLPYQRHLISNLDSKHKEWSKKFLIKKFCPVKNFLLRFLIILSF